MLLKQCCYVHKMLGERSNSLTPLQPEKQLDTSYIGNAVRCRRMRVCVQIDDRQIKNESKIYCVANQTEAKDPGAL